MINQNYNEIVVVEGKNDASRIRKIYPHINVLITNGSEVSEEFILNLKKLEETNDIILFLDPDYPGQRIRHLLEQNLNHPKHAFIEKAKAKDDRKHKVGVEHATDSDIINSLNNLLTISNKELGNLTSIDLIDLGLVGKEDSKEKRILLANHYPIGYTNGKTLLKRLNYLNLKKEDIEVVLNDLYRNSKKNKWNTK